MFTVDLCLPMTAWYQALGLLVKLCGMYMYGLCSSQDGNSHTLLLQLVLAVPHKVSTVQVILLESAVAGIGNTSRVYSGTSKR